MQIQKVLFLLTWLFILFAQETEDFTLVCKMFMFIINCGKCMYNTFESGMRQSNLEWTKYIF